MKNRSLAGAVANVVLVASLIGCSGLGGLGQAQPEATPTPPPWPVAWDTAFCLALDNLTDAVGRLREASELATSSDIAGATAAIETASTGAREAQQALDIVGIWPAARSVAVYLSSAADEEQKATDLISNALESEDVSLIEESIKHQEKATYQLGRATKAGEVLAAKYGRPCR